MNLHYGQPGWFYQTWFWAGLCIWQVTRRWGLCNDTHICVYIYLFINLSFSLFIYLYIYLFIAFYNMYIYIYIMTPIHDKWPQPNCFPRPCLVRSRPGASNHQDRSKPPGGGGLVASACHLFLITMGIWLVVWTPLKNISQLGWLFPIYGKIKMFQTTNQGCDECQWILDDFGQNQSLPVLENPEDG